MADGFEENAVFFDLTYEDPDAVELGVAFEEIAPCSGCALVRVAASSSTSSRALPWPTPTPSSSTLLRSALS